MAQDSSRPEFWESRYRDGVIPWDAGKVPESLPGFARTLVPGARVLIPGCGSAYEAAYLARNKFHVLAIDFSPAAVAAARRTLGDRADIVRLADFFADDLGEPFDVIYERAFLCALPRTMWDSYATRCAQLLKPNGMIAGFFFFAQTPKGPPFGTSAPELHGLLGRDFAKTQDEAVADSIDVFAGKERWMVWQRNP